MRAKKCALCGLSGDISSCRRAWQVPIIFKMRAILSRFWCDFLFSINQPLLRKAECAHLISHEWKIVPFVREKTDISKTERVPNDFPIWCWEHCSPYLEPVSRHNMSENKMPKLLLTQRGKVRPGQIISFFHTVNITNGKKLVEPYSGTFWNRHPHAYETPHQPWPNSAICF